MRLARRMNVIESCFGQGVALRSDLSSRSLLILILIIGMVSNAEERSIIDPLRFRHV
jgi:hypothetical protein